MSTVNRLTLNARVRLLPTELGGKRNPIRGDYRPSWNLGNTWLGSPTLNDGRVLLDDGIELAPGFEAPARIEPLAPEFWGKVQPGAVLPMQEGSRVVGYAVILGIQSVPEHFTPDVASFVAEARQFCDFMRKAPGVPLAKRLAAARQRLLSLYDAGSRLPHVEPPAGVDAGPNPGAPEGWIGFDKFETYWEVFDPYVDDAPVVGSLSDDLLDVYFDVRRGLELWDREVPMSAAIWEWRFHFDIHWGDHAIDALRALHRACREESSAGNE